MPNSSSALFIVFEGLDGSGKTTQIELLAERLRNSGQEVYLTAEPTSELPTGRLIRRILQGEHQVDARTLAALFAADRLEHLLHPRIGILDRLAAGQTVISSRYYFSSLAYQAETGELGWVAQLNSQARELRKADLTIFLDLSPEESMRRIHQARHDTELFETEVRLERARRAFYRAFEYWGEKEVLELVDASKPVEEVEHRIWTSVAALLNEPTPTTDS